MRGVLWDRYERLFKPGQTVLDIGCGTGIDAVYLAWIGICVIGIDASPTMIAEARAKVSDWFNDRIVFRVMDATEIGSLPEGSVDGIISAFASLNTVDDVAGFGAAAARLLKPGGTMLLHLLNRWSLWEWMGLIRTGRFDEARRLGRNQERNFNISGRPVRHRLYHARDAYTRCFAAHFRLRRAYGLGILRPPHTVQRIPAAIVNELQQVEPMVRARRPFRDWGRFFVLELERR